MVDMHNSIYTPTTSIPLPDGYDGQVILNPRAEFLGVINGEEVWSPDREIGRAHV